MKAPAVNRAAERLLDRAMADCASPVFGTVDPDSLALAIMLADEPPAVRELALSMAAEWAAQRVSA